MNTYELMVLYKADLKEADVKKHISTLKKKIEDFGGKVSKEDYWGIKDLSYEINKQTQAYYYILVIKIGTTKIKDLSSWMKRQEDSIFRNMITRV